MTYDIEAIRKQDALYARRFREKWMETYGTPFDHDTLLTKRWAAHLPSDEAQHFIKEYTDKIRNIKSTIEP